jgi:hypothetical protein
MFSPYPLILPQSLGGTYYSILINQLGYNLRISSLPMQKYAGLGHDRQNIEYETLVQEIRNTAKSKLASVLLHVCAMPLEVSSGRGDQNVASRLPGR